MKFRHDELPDRINKHGVRIQSRDCGALNVAHICFPAGANAKPLLEGLVDNLCQVPRWGMVLEGSIDVVYADGTTEKVSEGEVYYWPPGHTFSVDESYRAIEFSPREEMGDLIEHLRGKMAA